MAPAPVPTSAWWEDDFGGIRVVFDQPLTPGPLNTDNWRVVVAGHLRRLINAGVVGNEVRGQTQAIVITSGSWVDYVPPPFDVRNLESTPALGFTRFPVNAV